MLTTVLEFERCSRGGCVVQYSAFHPFHAGNDCDHAMVRARGVENAGGRKNNQLNRCVLILKTYIGTSTYSKASCVRPRIQTKLPNVSNELS